MITEIALTPTIFDPSAHAVEDDWSHLISHFAAKLSSQDLNPAVFTDFGGLWHPNAIRLVMTSSPSTARDRVQKFLSFMKDRRLIRKLANGKVQLDDDEWWVRMAFQSACCEPIERIVAPSRIHQALKTEFSRLFSFRDVDHEPFWEGIESGCSIAANRDVQIAKLRKLLVHGEFVWLASPYMTGLEDDDSPFAREVIRSAFRRTEPFSLPREVRIFTKHHDRVDPKQHEQNLKQFFANAIPPGKQVFISICPKFEERILLAGEFSTGSSGPERRPRWGVHMGHIAQKRDVPDKKHEWKLLNNEGLSHWYRLYHSFVKT